MKGIVRWVMVCVPGLMLGAATPPTVPDSPPRPLVQTAPVYPAALKEQRVIGSANIQCLIDETGAVQDLVVERASREEFGVAAVAAIAQWKYSPAIKAGQPHAVKVGIPVDFSFGDAELAEMESQRTKEPLPDGPPTFAVDELSEWPELKKEIRPDTPRILRQNRQIGQAVMRMVVDEQGVPRDIHGVINTHAECATAAVETIRQWRFTPGKKDGRVVRVALEVVMIFFPEDLGASGLRVRPGVRLGLKPTEQALPLKNVTTWPKPTKQEGPRYPGEMSTRGHTGKVVVEFIINERGVVTQVRSHGETNQFFAAQAERAVSYWRFTPAMLDGAPVAVRASQEIQFDIRTY